MRYKDVQTGQTFFFEDNFSYPKRKTPHGHLDIRDDVTGYMPDDTPVITLAELAALTARVKELEEALTDALESMTKQMPLGTREKVLKKVRAALKGKS